MKACLLKRPNLEDISERSQNKATHQLKSRTRMPKINKNEALNAPEDTFLDACWVEILLAPPQETIMTRGHIFLPNRD